VKFPRWKFAPEGSDSVHARNYRYVQIDGIGIGIAGAASTFLPIFLTRLGGSSFQLGLLSAMPAVTGFLFALPIGRFLQNRRDIVRWFSTGRLLVYSAFLLTGLVPFLVPRSYIVPIVLLVWASVTVPQTVVNVAFSVVMNEVAGPEGRYFLMSRRWTMMGMTNAVIVALVGRVLDSIPFPVSYQAVFMTLSFGGLVSFWFSSRIDLADFSRPVRSEGSILGRFQWYALMVKKEPAFLSYIVKRFVFLFGTSMAAPLFPLYYVRVIHGSDTWIGSLNTIQTLAALLGYSLWSRLSRERGNRFVLLAVTLGLGLHPAVVAIAGEQSLITVLAACAGLFQSGLDLVFFDELMRTVPKEYSATFVSINHSVSYFAAVLSPLLGSLLADLVGIPIALAASTVFRLAGFALFLLGGRSGGAQAPPIADLPNG
jgi:hypothetical protein